MSVNTWSSRWFPEFPTLLPLVMRLLVKLWAEKVERLAKGNSTVVTVIISYRKTGRFLYLSSGRGIIDTKFRLALGSGEDHVVVILGHWVLALETFTIVCLCWSDAGWWLLIHLWVPELLYCSLLVLVGNRLAKWMLLCQVVSWILLLCKLGEHTQIRLRGHVIEEIWRHWSWFLGPRSLWRIYRQSSDAVVVDRVCEESPMEGRDAVGDVQLITTWQRFRI